ncbi:type II toxin-antitoxin system YafQ family toxin [Testudinibacter sp. TR-2022]|uniref:type II toxin-antitoxin system YafQ family toxin n=1 Tax=Testudinibacter sp. TR-2022 TaxID=2585029 RepID=UPI001118AB2A|nr:type II toxin-antitoxin system YafQ family toxin [Testudinibacter sp. TR-2022]TNH05280.1 type II toxin-antitoxin system YafQ family toxin [Pasteurellaceae bacterium Phil11]TNH19480.1 type II toxin-antitoxin system YafQ family toxin [Testudinibacter sp. TR-2022]TNH27575.1 type II toxin-antitoxin system YafQ family toxin [Testudinibacter sp. TR-2022]
MNNARKIEIFSSFRRNAKKYFLQLASVEWAEVVTCLTQRVPLPERYRDHQLKGNLKAFRDCHIKNDLVLLYKISDDDNTVELHYLDTHSEIFKNADH